MRSTERKRPLLLSGDSHPELAEKIAACLNLPLVQRELHLFPDGEIGFRLSEPVEGRDVFVIQSSGKEPNRFLMELLIMLDALKRASAASIHVILPYYAYARQDRIDRLGKPITARLIADLLTCAGATHLMTMDLHAEQIEGFFNIPVHHLISAPLLMPHCKAWELEDCVVVAPDKGGVRIASTYAKGLGIPLALFDKERIDSFRVEMRHFVGEVSGKTVLLTDDMCATAGTLVQAAEQCAQLGACRILAVVGHGVLTDEAIEKIDNSPIERLLTTDSVPLSQAAICHSKLQVISIAPLIADAICTGTPERSLI